MNAIPSSTILRSEQDFFDREALQMSDENLRIAPDQVERYRNARQSPWNSPKDALFASLLPVAGKKILDYGCGTGDVAVELALCGAEVTAFDLSPVSIARCRRRAELHGVAHRMQFDERAAGATDYPPDSFDIVVGTAILHHLHTELPRIYAELDRVVKPGGTVCFQEPVANSRLLRGLRRCVPVKTHATPDERQLHYEDFEPLRQYFPHLEFKHFYCLERLKRILGGRRTSPLRWVDARLQQVFPFLRRAYGIVLVIARR